MKRHTFRKMTALWILLLSLIAGTAQPAFAVTRLTITSQPSTQIVEAGQLHKFIVEVNLTSGTTYQWQVKESDSAAWRNFTEKKTALTKQLWFTVTENMHMWRFRCIVKNGTQSVISVPFIVYIKGKEVPKVSPTAAPTKAPIVTPTKAPTVTPTKAPAATPTKAPAVTPTKAPTAVPTKAPAVTPAPTAAPSAIRILSQPSDMTIAPDQLYKFIVEADPADGSSYQWQVKENASSAWRDFTEKKTALTKQLWFTVTSAMHGWQFRCVVKNGADSVISAPFTVL